MNDHDLHTSWQRVWSGLHARGDAQSAFADLVSRWREPQRHYHSPQHLRECLAAFDGAAALALHPAEVEAAVWFHDAVYNLRESGNEEKSAQLAQRVLGAAGVHGAAVERIVQLVLATRHTSLPAQGDETLLVDIDLSILGAAPARFDEYDRQISAEYSFVPPTLFRRKRREVLASFAARPRLYGTAHFHERLDPAARANLARAIELYGS